MAEPCSCDHWKLGWKSPLSCPGTKVEAFEEWNEPGPMVRGEHCVLPKGETGGVGTRNPDARPLNNHRGEASMDRDGPERKKNIHSRKREGSVENQLSRRARLVGTWIEMIPPGMARIKEGA